MNRDKDSRPVGTGGSQHVSANGDIYLAGRDQHIHFGEAPDRRRSMPTSVGVVARLYVGWGWVAILLAVAMALLGFEGVASAAAGKRPAVSADVMTFLIGIVDKTPPELDSRAAAVLGACWLGAALGEILLIQWYFRMVRGIRRGDAESHTKVLNLAYSEVFLNIGLIAVGFALAVPILAVLGFVFITSTVVTISVLNTRSAHDWFVN